MREIKFRFWDIHDKKFITWPENVYIAGNGKIYTYANIEADLEEKLISMQYTGLKDKNGKEIYEGYILDGDFPDVVFWDNDRGQWMLRNRENPDDTLWEILRDNNPEIIGNIYENPELLEANQ